MTGVRRLLDPDGARNRRLREEIALARILYADVLDELEQHLCDVTIVHRGLGLLIVVPFAADQRIEITGREPELPWSLDRTELGGWNAVHLDDRYGAETVVHRTTTPPGHPPGDLSVPALGQEVALYLHGRDTDA